MGTPVVCHDSILPSKRWSLHKSQVESTTRWGTPWDAVEGRRLVVAVEELLQEARRLDLSRPEGPFRLGEIAEALRRKLPATTDLFDRLAIDLEVDRDTITEAWFVASAFPPATRRLGLPWRSYQILRFHPERQSLVDRAVSAGWDQTRIQRELSARFAARHLSPPDQPE
jgi:hypothetical protein